MTRPILLMAFGLACFGGAAAAEERHQHAPAQAGGEPATEAYLAASERMHEGMTIELTGDLEIGFAKAMIPRHQGAIDMAQVLLE